MGHTSKCARENFSEQLKHSPFSRFTAISAGVRHCKRGAAGVAPYAAPEVAGAGRAKTLVDGGVRPTCGRAIM
jgi:hypothetical protein